MPNPTLQYALDGELPVIAELIAVLPKAELLVVPIGEGPMPFAVIPARLVTHISRHEKWQEVKS